MNTSSVLSEKSLRNTTGREAILTIIKKASRPLDVETIQERLKKTHTINRATVFRTVNTLTEKGILKRLEFGEGKYRYELASLPHHHHAICTECGKVEDISSCNLEPIEEKISKEKLFSITSHSLEFFGICAQCT